MQMKDLGNITELHDAPPGPASGLIRTDGWLPTDLSGPGLVSQKIYILLGKGGAVGSPTSLRSAKHHREQGISDIWTDLRFLGKCNILC